MAADLTNLSEEAQSLARVPLFRRLEPTELEKLAEEIDQVNFKDGELIFNQHDRGDSLYVVESGSVRIWVVDEDVSEVTLAELKPGEFFGEMAVLDRGERSSSATAIGDTHLHPAVFDRASGRGHRCDLRNRSAHATDKPARITTRKPKYQRRNGTEVDYRPAHRRQGCIIWRLLDLHHHLLELSDCLDGL